MKRLEERKIYLQLHGAMEALIHICRDGCRTIGPIDKVLKGSDAPCNYPACNGLEFLVRHFVGCKNRVFGGCSHCKRMWQLLELHARLCDQMDECSVPLCRYPRYIHMHILAYVHIYFLLIAKLLRPFIGNLRRRCSTARRKMTRCGICW